MLALDDSVGGLRHAVYLWAHKYRQFSKLGVDEVLRGSGEGVELLLLLVRKLEVVLQGLLGARAL